MPVVIFGRKTLASVECMVWACAAIFPTRIVVRVAVFMTITIRVLTIIASVAPAIVVVTTIIVAMVSTVLLSLFIATTIVTISIALREGNATACQTHHQKGGNDCFAFHDGLHYVYKCHIRFARYVRTMSCVLCDQVSASVEDRPKDRQVLCLGAHSAGSENPRLIRPALHQRMAEDCVLLTGK
jgi:hypothetical protein